MDNPNAPRIPEPHEKAESQTAPETKESMNDLHRQASERIDAAGAALSRIQERIFSPKGKPIPPKEAFKNISKPVTGTTAPEQILAPEGKLINPKEALRNIHKPDNPFSTPGIVDPDYRASDNTEKSDGSARAGVDAEGGSQ